MLHDLFTALHFSPHECIIYETLLQHGPSKITDLAETTKLSKPQIYHAFETLNTRGLVSKSGLLVSPASPDALEALIESEVTTAQALCDAVQHELPSLYSHHLSNTTAPVIRYFEGSEGFKQIYEDVLLSGTRALWTIRACNASTTHDFIDKAWTRDYVTRRASADIVTTAITIDDPMFTHDPALDSARGIIRHWINLDDFTQPVEFLGYSHRVAIISYAEEVMGITIDHSEIAKAFSDVFELARKGALATTVTHDHL